MTHTSAISRAGAALVLALALACGSADQAHSEATAQGAATTPAESTVPTRAVCVLHPTEGSTVEGTVEFLATSAGVKIHGVITGLTPGDHGFHVHEFGDCSAPDGSSAGGHFNPMAQPHAGPDSEARHMGDLGNLWADSTGTAVYDRTDSHLTLTGPAGILGRGLIVHAKPDDLVSQPTGAAGARVACGTIGVAGP